MRLLLQVQRTVIPTQCYTSKSHIDALPDELVVVAPPAEEDVFGNDHRVALILDVAGPLAKTTFGWVNKTLLEVISESR